MTGVDHASTETNMSEFYGHPGDGAGQKTVFFTDPSTGEIAGGAAEAVSGARARRYELLGAIRRIDPTHRTASCLWSRVSTGAQVNVVKDIATARARYTGLRVCSRIWTCPCCAAKISERRAAELAAAIGQARTLDLHVSLLTVTAPHVRQDDLATLIERLGVAWRSYTTGRVSARLRAALGLVGTIRNIEVTHGENGWHPHYHCLLIHKTPLGPDQIKDVEAAWGAHWQHCAVKAGLRRPSDAHGLTLQAGDYAARYVGKWGMEHEMTKSMAKRSRRAGRTPFDIAEDFGDGLETARNAALWREFAEAMHRQQQLFWSKGLKDLLQVRDVEDAELCAEEDARPAELVVQLTWPEWRAVRARHRATLLDLAERAPDLVRPWLDGLVEPPSEPPPQAPAGAAQQAAQEAPQGPAQAAQNDAKEASAEAAHPIVPLRRKGGCTPRFYTGGTMGGVRGKAAVWSAAENRCFPRTWGLAPRGLEPAQVTPPRGSPERAADPHEAPPRGPTTSTRRRGDAHA